MSRYPRREFLANVGRGMLVASAGYQVAVGLGLSPAYAGEEPGRLDFGPHEALAEIMQTTPMDQLQSVLVDKLRSGTDLRTLVAAAALANARACGGEDYVGFHSLMAMRPAMEMAAALPTDRSALPVLKVLYRNSGCLHAHGGHDKDLLHPVAIDPSSGAGPPEALRDTVRRQQLAEAERAVCAKAAKDPSDAYNSLLMAVHDGVDVHRVVLAYRAWDMLDVVGKEHASTMLRNSLHYCVKNEPQTSKYAAGVRTLLPKLLDEYHLMGRELGSRRGDDAWVQSLGDTLFKSTPEEAARAIAQSLGENFSVESVSEAVALAANQLVLRDAGRPANQTAPNKPVGSVHGDSIGVHASDSANAWGNIARISNARNSMASLILSGYQVASDRVNRGGDFLTWKPRPTDEVLKKVATRDPKELLKELDGAVRSNDQERACAVAARYEEAGHPAQAAFDVLLDFALSQDGALHAEKYYHTTHEEYGRARPTLRGRQLISLARVTASCYGYPAPGYDEACKLLKV